MMEDPYRMYLVAQRGAFEELEVGCVLAGAAAVAAVRRFAADEERSGAIAAWRRRPGKVALRARGGQWDEVLRTEDFAYAGDLDGAAVLALPPMRRSERSELLRRVRPRDHPPPQQGRRRGRVPRRQLLRSGRSDDHPVRSSAPIFTERTPSPEAMRRTVVTRRPGRVVPQRAW
jgi:hypothetical protein